MHTFSNNNGIDSESTYGSSKYRRQQLNKAIEQLKKAIPLSPADSNKLSQLQALHYACIYMRKQNLISEMQKCNYPKMNELNSEDLFKNICGTHFGISDTIHGFVIAVSRSGHLVYVSDNVINYLGHSSIDVLLSADKFTDILHPMDENTIKSILDGETIDPNNHYEFITSWYVSKIRRRVYTRSDTKIKISGRFVANNGLFIALCTPMLRVAERDYMDYLVAASPICFTTVHSLDLKFMEICEKGQNILGYNCSDLDGVSLYEITNFKNLKDLRKNHKSLLNNKSQRGKLETIQLLMKNGSYLNCLVNMYYGNNYIICRFQSFSESEMNEYDNYSALISNYNNSHLTNDDIDGGSDLQMSPSGSFDGSDNDQFYGGGHKRRVDDMNDDYNEDDSEFQSSDSEESIQISANESNSKSKSTKNKKMKTSSSSSSPSPAITTTTTITSKSEEVSPKTSFNYINNNNQNAVLKTEVKIESPSFDSQSQQQQQQQQQQIDPIYYPQQQQQQQQFYTQNYMPYQQPEAQQQQQLYYIQSPQNTNYPTNQQIQFQSQISFINDFDWDSININEILQNQSFDSTIFNTNIQYANLNSSSDDSNNSYNSPVQSPEPNKFNNIANAANGGFMNDDEYEQLLSMLDEY